uniref:FMRFamide-3 n=2 Tax=Lucilia cuprina TaxID=7375 RepID=FAR3_LUCCU|nr:RecName: Full=FMRFamide-3; AltName: Full=LucFMRFamide-3 [Lucilia cuprina]
SANTKNDFMRF